MPSYTRRNCANPPRGCGKHDSEVGPISWGGLCQGCGRRELFTNIDQMEARSGPNWTKWRERMAACVGGALLDDGARRP